MTLASASGKIILFGEHAVVYGRPAIAVPLPQLRAKVRVEDKSTGGVIILALDLGKRIELASASPDEPLAHIVRSTLSALAVSADPLVEIGIESEIPIAGGLGSGAAVSTAIVRALAAHFGAVLTPQQVSALVYETESLHHGTPSGIDNTVIALEHPIWFMRETGAQPFEIASPLTLAIADTGVSSPTRLTVGDVRRGWEGNPAYYENLFDQIGEIVREARASLEVGENDALGPLMDRNQVLLRTLGVSSDENERLVAAARSAGAWGAKVSGGGRGGNIIAALDPGGAEAVRGALTAAGAAKVIVTVVGP